MSPNVLRCRHLEVNWLTTHSCRCSNCGKHGHWFENAGLVMWVREDEYDAPRSPMVPDSNDFLHNQTQQTLPNMAG